MDKFLSWEKGNRLSGRNNCLNKVLFEEGFKSWSLLLQIGKKAAWAPRAPHRTPHLHGFLGLISLLSTTSSASPHRRLSLCMVRLKLRLCVLPDCDIGWFQTLVVLAVFKSWYDTAFGDTSQVCRGELKWNENYSRKKADSNVLDEVWGTTVERNMASGLLKRQPLEI